MWNTTTVRKSSTCSAMRTVCLSPFVACRNRTGSASSVVLSRTGSASSVVLSRTGSARSVVLSRTGSASYVVSSSAFSARNLHQMTLSLRVSESEKIRDHQNQKPKKQLSHNNTSKLGALSDDSDTKRHQPLENCQNSSRLQPDGPEQQRSARLPSASSPPISFD